MQTSRLTMSQALVRFLDQQYVRMDGIEYKFFAGIVGIFGHGNVTGIGEALEYSGCQLRFMQGHNEQGMVHMAIAYAKQKNRLSAMACTSSIGPGALNMVTGAATATINRIPVLLLPGDSFACRQPDPVLQQLENPADYSMSVNDCFKPVSKYWDRIVRPEQLMTACLNAMRVLTDPVDTGAVTLCLPQDVQAEAYDYPESFFVKRVHDIDRRELAARALHQAVTVLAQAKRPIIIAGGGVHYALATTQLAAFAEAFGIPVAETQAGKSALSWEHPCNVGAIGVTGSAAANKLMQEADVVLAVGTRLSDFTTISKSAWPASASLLHLNVSAFDGLKQEGILLQADAKAGLQAIQRELMACGYRTTDGYQTKIRELAATWQQEVTRVTHETRHPNSQVHLLGLLNNALLPTDVIVCAAGSLPGDLHRLWRASAPKSYHLEYGFSCMGYEVAGGLGVKMAEPSRNVYVLVGDGSFLMLHSELLTSLQEGYKITVILFNNHGYQCIRHLQCAHGSQGFGNEFKYRSADSKQLDGAPLQVDFVKYTEALGVRAYHATHAGEFAEKLLQCQQETQSCVLVAEVDPASMSKGYESWWRVDIAEVSNSPAVQKARQAMTEKIKTAKVY